jgi:OOP family OmpA-OmpF porin
MKKNIRYLALAASLAVSFSAAAETDSYQGSWYALPGISYNWTDSDLKAKDDVGGFLRAGKEINQNWDVQFGGSYASVDGNTNGKYKQTLLGVDALYMLSREKLRPFLLAGIGYAHNKTDYSTLSASKDSFMGNIGAGVQYLVTDNIGLQADLREVWSQAEVGTTGASDSKTVANTVLNFGAIFRFGAPAAPAAPAPEPVQAPAPAPVVAQVEPTPAPAPVAAPAPKPACKPKMETITIQSEALFDFDKSTIKGKYSQILEEVAAKIKKHNDVEFVLVTGHTDRIGTDEYNQKLSERRADAVKKYLAAHGVSDVRIRAVGKGESEPIVDCKYVKGFKKIVECLAPNRRVVVDASHMQEDGCSE